MTRNLFFMLIALAGILTTVQSAKACTAITLKATDGATVQGRTMEWGAFNLESEMLVIPRGNEFSGVTPDGKPGLSWKTRYGVLGINALGRQDLTDGMNEKGLVVSVLYLPGFAEFQPYDPKKADISISQSQVAGWLLTSCDTTETVRAELPKIRVVPVPEEAIGGIPLPIHFLVTDAQGKSIVIEYTGGKLNIYDNKVGVLTNSPEYPWHLTNLRNYVTHSTKPVESMTVGELEVTPLGGGSGMLGLPGDYTPPSRFIQAAALRNTVPPLKTGARAVEEVFRILNNFDIPIGAMGVDEEDPSVLGDTQWTSVADTQSRLYYYRTMNNHRIRVVDLKTIDFSKGEIRSQPLDPELAQDYQKVVVE